MVTKLDLLPFAELIKGEVNVKEVRVQTAEESGLEVSTELAVLPREWVDVACTLAPAIVRPTR